MGAGPLLRHIKPIYLSDGNFTPRRMKKDNAAFFFYKKFDCLSNGVIHRNYLGPTSPAATPQACGAKAGLGNYLHRCHLCKFFGLIFLTKIWECFKLIFPY